MNRTHYSFSFTHHHPGHPARGKPDAFTGFATIRWSTFFLLLETSSGGALVVTHECYYLEALHLPRNLSVVPILDRLLRSRLPSALEDIAP